MATKRKGGGSRLNRSETVTIRVDPKLRHLIELGARKLRRTVSSYAEWALEESLKAVDLERTDRHGDAVTLYSLDLWDVDEADRFAKVAFTLPELLIHEEQVMWKLVRRNGYFWKLKGSPEDGWTWDEYKGALRFDALREQWENLQAIARGERDEGSLPTIEKNPDHMSF